ncbi:MAG: hypothetical protein ACHQ7M_12675, partial [Chloroflexota bacterium]
LEITSVPVGTNLYIFQVPAGSYCFTSFQFGRWHFFAQDKQEQMGCFEVKAGQLGYSGTLSPRVINGQLVTNQDVQMPEFRILLKERYPTIAKQFLPPEIKPYTSADLAAPATSADVPISDTAAVPASVTPHKPPPAGTDQISTWMEEIPGTRAEVIFFRNNTGWPMEVRKFELYECVAVKQACGVQKFRLLIAPHVTKQAMIVEPDLPQDVYTFRYRYIYGFAQSGNKR